MKCLIRNSKKLGHAVELKEPLDHSVQPALSHCKPVDQAMDEYNMNRKQLQTMDVLKGQSSIPAEYT